MCYEEYYRVVREQKIKPTTILGCKLAYQTYEPNPNHKLADLNEILVTVLGAVRWGDVIGHNMDWIIRKLKDEAKSYCALHREEVPGWVAKYPNHEVLVDALTGEEFNLRDSGIKYLIVTSTGLGVPCFCEEIY